MPSLETSLQDPSHISTINGFRLGRLPGLSVDWAELNTAWGLAVLLLRALVTRVQLQLRGYELVPYGDQSYIKLLDDGKVLPLYWHGSGMLELQTNHRRSFTITFTFETLLRHYGKRSLTHPMVSRP